MGFVEIIKQRMNKNEEVFISEKFLAHLKNPLEDEMGSEDIYHNELFALGLILLKIGTFQDIRQIYDLNDYTIDRE